MPRVACLTHMDPADLWRRVFAVVPQRNVDAFLEAPWSYSYQADDEMDTLALEGLTPFLPIEQQNMYASVLCKFANVSPHRDTHDDEYYLLYVLSGTARLHVGSRQTQSMDLSPGMCVLFNCDALHWAEGDGDHPVQVVIGGMTRARGRAILYSSDPRATFESMMAEARLEEAA